MRPLALALLLASALPLRATAETDLVKVFQTLYAVSDAAAMLEGLKSGGKLPNLKGPGALSRAVVGSDAMTEFLVDGWTTPLHIESTPGKGYLIVAAGSDRKFDRSTWFRPAKTTSTADDVVLRDGNLIRSPEEWALVEAKITKEQLEAEGARSRHARTISMLRQIMLALQSYEIDAGKFPPATDIDSLAKYLEPVYVKTMPRTDAWERKLDFMMVSTLDGYYLGSAGPDGKHDTGDDIVVEDRRIVKNSEPPLGDRIADAWAGYMAAQLRLKAAR